MSSQILFWVIGFVFFQPLHLGLPILYLFIYTKEKGRSEKVKSVLLLGIASSALLFICAAWLSQEHLYLAIIVLVISIPLPWFGLRKK
ncbi:MAG: hypothetical protein V7784_16980 [Oceanospirillaceae bacterium]